MIPILPMTENDLPDVVEMIHAQLQFGVRGMEVHHLFVQHAQRGGGIGRALMRAAQVRAQELGCRYLTVGTHVDNAAAQAM